MKHETRSKITQISQIKICVIFDHVSFRQLRQAMRAVVVLITLLSCLAAPEARAHQVIEIGNNLLEVVWEVEPPLAGQANAVVIRVRGKPVSQSGAGKLTLITPLEGMTISGSALPISVQIEPGAGQVAATAWHIYLNDQLVASPPVEQTTVLLQDVADGAYLLKVVLADAAGQEIGAPLTATVTLRDPNAPMTIPPPVSVRYVDLDLSGLAMMLTYREESQPLAFQPLSASSIGQYHAPYTPAAPGLYLLRVQGALDGQPVDAQIALDVVQERAGLPALLAGSGRLWTIVMGLIVGITGLGLWVRSKKSG